MEVKRYLLSFNKAKYTTTATSNGLLVWYIRKTDKEEEEEGLPSSLLLV